MLEAFSPKKPPTTRKIFGLANFLGNYFGQNLVSMTCKLYQNVTNKLIYQDLSKKVR